MENEPEVIRDQMQDTRTALAEKLEALEQQVAKTVENTTRPVIETVQTVTEATKETVGSVKDTVSQIAETVSESVESTVSTVKDTFDLSRHVDQHPWAMMFGSAAVGFIVGRMLPSAPASREWSGDSMTSRMAASPINPRREPRGHDGHNGHKKQKAVEEKSWVSSFLENYKKEIGALEELGVAAVAGVIRDLVTQNLQGEIGSRLGEWVNGLTEKLGAKPLAEPILAKEEDESRRAETMSSSRTEARHSR